MHVIIQLNNKTRSYYDVIELKYLIAIRRCIHLQALFVEKSNYNLLVFY